ncbi:MAG: hypothetical protein IKW95_01710 [Lachnospiraceae bacterium]|nr:hypothetical protein [Lachnospiraceae bacterium]
MERKQEKRSLPFQAGASVWNENKRKEVSRPKRARAFGTKAREKKLPVPSWRGRLERKQEKRSFPSQAGAGDWNENKRKPVSRSKLARVIGTKTREKKLPVPSGHKRLELTHGKPTLLFHKQCP